MTQSIKESYNQFFIYVNCIINANKNYFNMLLRRPLLGVILSHFYSMLYKFFWENCI